MFESNFIPERFAVISNRPRTVSFVNADEIMQTHRKRFPSERRRSEIVFENHCSDVRVERRRRRTGPCERRREKRRARVYYYAA